MRFRHVTTLALLVIATAAVLAAVITGPASATPSKTTRVHELPHRRRVRHRHRDAEHEHAGGGSRLHGRDQHRPHRRAATPAITSPPPTPPARRPPGSRSPAVPAPRRPGRPNMTAPAAAGTYYYKVWCAKGPSSSSGQAKARHLQHHGAARPPAAAHQPLAHERPVGTTLTISAPALGASGRSPSVASRATTSAWSPTSITCTVPAGLTVGRQERRRDARRRRGLQRAALHGHRGPGSDRGHHQPHAEPRPGRRRRRHRRARTSAPAAPCASAPPSATTTAWSATSVTATVPASLAAGATSVTVTPTGGAASNAARLHRRRAAGARDSTAPHDRRHRPTSPARGATMSSPSPWRPPTTAAAPAWLRSSTAWTVATR